MADKKLSEYIFRLVLDSDLRARYQADAKAQLEISGLSSYMQDVMLRGDLVEILKELADEAGIEPGDHFHPV